MIRKSTFAAKTAKLLAAAIAGATVMAAPVQAGTIDFEDLAYYGAIGGTEFVTTGSYGIGFYANTADGGAGSLVGSIITPGFSDCTDMACPVDNQTSYYASLNDGYADIISLDAAVRMSVNSFDASFIGGVASLTGYPVVSGLLRIQGVLASGASVTETYQLDGPTAAGFEFGHFETSAAFRANQFTEILIFGFACNASGSSCTAFNSDRGQFALDNLSLTDVPEPASLALFGLGLAGLSVAARRKQA